MPVNTMSHESIARNNEAVAWKFAVPFFLLIALLFLSSLFPIRWFWGLSAAMYLPPYLVLTFGLFGVVVASPSVAMHISSLVERIGGVLFPENHRHFFLTAGIVSVGFGLALWLVPMPFPFLGGDGVHVIRRLFRYNVGLIEDFGQLKTEYLTVSLYSFLGKLTHTQSSAQTGLDITGYTTLFRIAGVLVGTCFLATVLHCARRITAVTLERVALTMSLVALPGTLFFLGYVEFYLFVYLFGTSFILFGVMDFAQGRFLVLTTVVLVTAIAFHLSAAVFIPSYVFLVHSWLSRRSGKALTNRTVSMSYGIVLSILGIIAYFWLTSGDRVSFFIPFTAEGSLLSLTSPRHIADVANHLVLLAFVPGVIVLITTFIGKKRILEIPSVLFLLIAGLSWTGLCLTQYAFAHDWDIFALLGPILGVAAVLIAARITPAALRRYLLVQCTLQPLVFVVPWFVVHLNRDAALKRYEELSDAYVGLLPGPGIAGFYETLRSAAVAEKDPESEVAFIRKAIGVTDDPYEYLKLLRAIAGFEALTISVVNDVTTSLDTLAVRSRVSLQIPVGEDSLARRTSLEHVVVDLLRLTVRHVAKERRPEWAESFADRFRLRGASNYAMYAFTGNTYFETNDFSRAIDNYRAALKDTNTSGYKGAMALPMILNRLAVAHFQTGNRPASLTAFRQAVSLPDVTAPTWSDYGFACYQSMEFREAAAAFTQALDLDPNLPTALYCLGKILFLERDRNAEAQDLLMRFTALERGTERARDAESLLHLAKQQTGMR